jgi:hypothetical protein
MPPEKRLLRRFCFLSNQHGRFGSQPLGPSGVRLPIGNRCMNWLLRACFWCAAICWSSLGLSATKNASFELIPGRNVFKLQPLRAPVLPVPPTLPKVLPKVIITGITDVCGWRQVLVEISEPGQTVIRPVLSEGEQAAQVEVLHIDVSRCLVDVRIHGEQSTLALPSPSAPVTRTPRSSLKLRSK